MWTNAYIHVPEHVCSMYNYNYNKRQKRKLSSRVSTLVPFIAKSSSYNELVNSHHDMFIFHMF